MEVPKEEEEEQHTTDKPHHAQSRSKIIVSVCIGSPLCGKCLARLEISFDEARTTGTKTPLHDETAFPRTPSGEVQLVPVKAH